MLVVILLECLSPPASDCSARSTIQASEQDRSLNAKICQLQSKIVQLEDELAAQRGQLLGWRSHQGFIEQSLEARGAAEVAIKGQLMATQFEITAMQKMVTEQYRIIIGLERMNALTTLALLASMIFCSLMAT